MALLGSILAGIIMALLVLLFVRFACELLLAYVRGFRPKGVVAVLFELVFSATDPLLRPLRRLIPPLPLGNVSLDMSFIVLFIGLVLVRQAVLQL